MAISFRSQTTEKYYCPQCEKFLKFHEVYRNWKCPQCDHKVRIKLEIDGFIHACYRVTPDQLIVGEMVTLENEFIHQVLAITKNGRQFRLALKDYTVINFSDDEIITQIDGGWHLD
jgi:DNA-directed RNA polymerase subunit RPC12/RpoP